MSTKSNEPVTFTLPVSEQKVTLRPYTTARMRQATTAIFLRYSKINMKDVQGKSQEELKKADSDVVDIQDLPGTAIAEINEVTVKNFVVSIDGNEFGGDRDAILEACLDMHTDDFDALVGECNRINNESTLSDQKKA